MKNQFWAVGRWSGLDSEIKGSGPIMSNFWGRFFIFLGSKKILWKHHSVRTEKLHNNFIKMSPKKWNNHFIELKFECKYMKVGTRHLSSYLWNSVTIYSQKVKRHHISIYFFTFDQYNKDQSNRGRGADPGVRRGRGVRGGDHGGRGGRGNGGMWELNIKITIIIEFWKLS